MPTKLSEISNSSEFTDWTLVFWESSTNPPMAGHDAMMPLKDSSPSPKEAATLDAQKKFIKMFKNFPETNFLKSHWYWKRWQSYWRRVLDGIRIRKRIRLSARLIGGRRGVIVKSLWSSCWCSWDGLGLTGSRYPIFVSIDWWINFPIKHTLLWSHSWLNTRFKHLFHSLNTDAAEQPVW